LRFTAQGGPFYKIKELAMKQRSGRPLQSKKSWDQRYKEISNRYHSLPINSLNEFQDPRKQATKRELDELFKEKDAPKIPGPDSIEGIKNFFEDQSSKALAFDRQTDDSRALEDWIKGEYLPSHQPSFASAEWAKKANRLVVLLEESDAAQSPKKATKTRTKGNGPDPNGKKSNLPQAQQPPSVQAKEHIDLVEALPSALQKAQLDEPDGNGIPKKKKGRKKSDPAQLVYKLRQKLNTPDGYQYKNYDRLVDDIGGSTGGWTNIFKAPENSDLVEWKENRGIYARNKQVLVENIAYNAEEWLPDEELEKLFADELKKVPESQRATAWEEFRKMDPDKKQKFIRECS
jgi:hypothetical protein